MHGLVISTGSCDSGPYRHKVLELEVSEGEVPHKVRFIHESAFQVPAGVMEMVERKNLQRRLDMPLLFGDIISWSESDVIADSERSIKKFKRDKALYPARATGHGCELLLRGAINPDDRLHIYMHLFKKLRLPVNMLQVGIPNVYFNCWIEIRTNYDACIVTFSEFDSVCEIAMQEELITLPWNVTNNTYITHIHDSDSDDEHPWLVEDTYKGPKQELYGRAAFVSGKRTFFCVEHPDKMFIIPILGRSDVANNIGTQLKVDAIYNRFEDVYLVSKVHIPATIVSWSTDSHSRLRCSVHATQIPGIFFSKELGFMDDPDGKLSLLHLTRYAGSAFQVSIVDNGPSKSAKGRFRFRIVDLVSMARDSRIQKWLDVCREENNPPVVNNEIGTVVSQSHVFCSKHATLLFRLPQDIEVLPGKIVQFSAQFDFETNEFNIFSMEYLPNIALNFVVRRMIEHSPEEEQYVFQISKARLPDRADIPPLLCCDNFGYIDDLGLIKDVKKNKQYSVWVMLSVPDFNNAFRPARVTWEVVSASSKAPVDRVTAQCGGRVLDKVGGELLESGSESCFTNWSEPLTTYSEQQPPSVYQAEFADDKTISDNISTEKSVCRGRFASAASAVPAASMMHPSGFPPANIGDHTISGATPLSMGDVGTCSNNRKLEIGRHNATKDAGFAEPVSEKRKISVQSVLDEINRFAHDDGCRERCVIGCPFLKSLSNHIVKTPNFWVNCAEYPELAASIRKKIELQ